LKFPFYSSRPLKTLPKQYQPLPPEPKISGQFFHPAKTLSQAHTFPVSATVTRYGCIPHLHSLRTKTLSPVKPQDFKKHNLFPSKFTFTGSMSKAENLSVKNLSPPPAPYTACKNKSKHTHVKSEMQPLTQPPEQDLNKYEWYIGHYDRREAEKALLQENTDETFLVRDCSKKSNAEPYVLVVYYRRRVYNIKVRFLEESQQYMLGTGLRGDDVSIIPSNIIAFWVYVTLHVF
ncbi:CLNK protein, partial [Urocolius indicus]|nr:CLNK protein [Urocolius indicus]